MRLLKLFAPALVVLVWTIITACMALTAALGYVAVITVIVAVVVHLSEQVKVYRERRSPRSH